MMQAKKVIITCAVTGSIHTPSMSPHLPITPAEIAAEAIAAAKAGAAMIHLHARNPKTGRPDQSPELFRQFLPVIKSETDAIINITTGGGLGMTLEQRLAPAIWAKPEIASMNMGSLNFNIAGAAAKVTEWKFDWEKPYLESTADFIFDSATMVSFASRYLTIEQGDIIYTGTPGETRAMHPGDVVEVEIEGIGVLSNPVQDRKAAA